jgi:hypothetical protein
MIISFRSFFSSFRYAIDDASADWGLAEAQLASTLKGGSGIKGVSTVVSVKATTAGQKRKLESNDGGGKDKKKPTRRGLNLKKAKHH